MASPKFFCGTQTKRFIRMWFSSKRGVLSKVITCTVSVGIVFNQAIFPSVAAAGTGPAEWLRPPTSSVATSPLPTEVPSDAAISDDERDPLINMIDGYGLTLLSLDQLALQFGTDPEAAFMYVRDRIRTEPYAGSLRAPSSVIAASGGSLQDKSELLMVLLRKMGLDARIAEAPMTDEIADRLRSGVCAISLTSDPHIPQLLGLTSEATEPTIKRAQRDYRSLLDAAMGDIDASAAFSNNFGTKHYWVQYRGPDGWRDLDPSVADMVAGDAFTQPAALSQGGADPHMVTIAVVTETLTDGHLREQSVLTKDFVVRDTVGMPIQIGFMPAGAGLAGVLADKLGDAIDLAQRVKPVFILNWQPEIGRDFAQPGASASGGLSAGNEESPVTAVWIDIRSTAPGGETRTARRAVIDLLSAQTRRSASIPAEAVRQPQKGLRYAQELEGVRHITVSHGGLDPSEFADQLEFALASRAQIISNIEDGTIRAETLAWLAWTRAQGIAIGAERATRDLQSADGSICAFSGHANVMTWGVVPKSSETFSTWSDWTIDGIDLTSSSRTPDPKEIAALRLWNAAVRSAIETEVQIASRGNEVAAEQNVASTSLVLNGALSRLTPEDVINLSEKSAQDDLDAGYLIFGVPTDTTPVAAWWRIDPKSGAADARLASVGNGAGDYIPRYVNARAPGINSIGSRELAYLEGRRLPPRTPNNFPTSAGRGGDNEDTLFTLGIALVAVVVVSTFGYMIYKNWEMGLYGKPVPPEDQPPPDDDLPPADDED